MFKGKKIVVGITGGIAAYKAAELVRQLCKRDAEVDVVMTRNAQQFVTPLTFQTISSHPVHTDLFSSYQAEISHIALADKADLIIIAPATANIIAKCAAGIADDLLSSVILSTKAPVLIAPAMNTKMWENSVTKHNVAKLKERGFTFAGPATGELACGYDGKGRLAETDDILEEVIVLLTKKDLQGERILITAGPTHEAVDPIRLLTNRSSGKMGYALARASQTRGAEVMLVTGPTTINPPPHVRTISVTSALEMDKAVSRHYKECTIVIKTAAVADYRPKKCFREKIKKVQKTLTLELERNPDILYKLGQDKGTRFLVGFAAETKNLISQAKAKLDRKNLDLIIVNHALQREGGFGSESNEVTIIDHEGKVDTLPRMKKAELADKILDKIKEVKAEKTVTEGQKKTAERTTKGKKR